MLVPTFWISEENMLTQKLKDFEIDSQGISTCTNLFDRSMIMICTERSTVILHTLVA